MQQESCLRGPRIPFSTAPRAIEAQALIQCSARQIALPNLEHDVLRAEVCRVSEREFHEQASQAAPPPVSCNGDVPNMQFPCNLQAGTKRRDTHPSPEQQRTSAIQLLFEVSQRPRCGTRLPIDRDQCGQI